jgi:outer membrane receptor protein involved in Fe transport
MTRHPNIRILVGLFTLLLYNSGLTAYHEVAGIQSGIWGLTESPYVVKNDIHIPKGLVLKIEAGVVIKFAGNYQITVEGALIANGTKAKPIVFTSIFDSELKDMATRVTNEIPQSPVWKGIEFSTNCDDYLTVLNHCILRYSQWGVRCINCYPLLTDIMLLDNEQSTLKINNEEYPYERGQIISPISQQSRPTITPLLEPVQETNIEKIKRLREQHKLKIERQQLRALQDSIKRANKINPVDGKTGRITLERNEFDQLDVQSINELISCLPGFFNIATIWTGYQLTNRGIPPTLTNNRVLFQFDGIPFYEPVAKTSYLEFVSLEAIERIECDRGIVLSPFNHHGIVGSVNFVPRHDTTRIVNNLKMELGTFGTKRLTAFLGINRNSTFFNLSTNFMNNSGYWRNFSQGNVTPFFRQKSASDRYNFSMFLRFSSLDMFVSYYENDQFQLGLLPQFQYTDPINRRGLSVSMIKTININSQLSGRIIGNYVQTYERSKTSPVDSLSSLESAAADNLLSKGNLLSLSILSQYHQSQYSTTAGVTVSRFCVEPLFEVKNKEGELIAGDNWQHATKIYQYEHSGFVKFGYNFSPFVGFDGITSIHITDSSERPDFSGHAKIIYNPFLPFDSYLKYSFAIRPATLIEQRIYVPDLIYGNSNLKSEQFEQWEWCSDIHLKQDLTFGFILYQSKNKNIIQLSSEYYFVNNSKIFNTTGCEVMLRGKIIDRSFFLTNIAYDHVMSSGWCCPQWKINGLANIQWLQHFSTIPTIQYLGQFETETKFGPYYLVNLSLVYQVIPKIKISLNGFNLLDQRPENPEYFRAEIAAVPVNPGRSLYITLAIE